MNKLRFELSDRRQTSRSVTAYSRNFAKALLNWETNRQEARFALSIFEPQRLPNKKSVMD